MAPARTKVAVKAARRGVKSAKVVPAPSTPQLSGASSSTSAMRGTQPSQGDQEEEEEGQDMSENAWADFDRLLLDRTLHLYATSPMHFPCSSNGDSSSSGTTTSTPSVSQLAELSASCTAWLSPRLATLTSAQSRPAVSVRAALLDTTSISLSESGWALQVRIRTATSSQSGANTVKRATELITAALIVLPGGLLLSRPASRVASSSGGPRSNLAPPLAGLLLAYLTSALDMHASSTLPARKLRGEPMGALLEKLWKTGAGGATAGASVEAAWDVDVLGGGKECESLTLTLPLTTASEACGGIGKAPIHDLLTSYLATHVSLSPPASTLHRIGVAGVHIGISGSSSSPEPAIKQTTRLPPGATAVLDVLAKRSVDMSEPKTDAAQEEQDLVEQPSKAARAAGLPSGSAAGTGTVRVKVTSTYGGDAGARLRMVCRWAARQILVDA